MKNKTKITATVLALGAIIGFSTTIKTEVSLSNMEQFIAAGVGLSATYAAMHLADAPKAMKDMFLQTGILDILYFPAKEIGTPKTSLDIMLNFPRFNWLVHGMSTINNIIKISEQKHTTSDKKDALAYENFKTLLIKGGGFLSAPICAATSIGLYGMLKAAFHYYQPNVA